MLSFGLGERGPRFVAIEDLFVGQSECRLGERASQVKAPRKRGRNRKTLAVQQAAQNHLLSSYLGTWNQRVGHRGARAPGANDENVPVDWLGGMTQVGSTEEDLNRELQKVGLCIADVRPCRYCGRRITFESQKAEVCDRQECRRAQARENKRKARQAQRELSGRRRSEPRLRLRSGEPPPKAD